MRDIDASMGIKKRICDISILNLMIEKTDIDVYKALIRPVVHMGSRPFPKSH